MKNVVNQFFLRLYGIKWNPFLGLAALLVLFGAAGVLFSFFYDFLMEGLNNPAGRFVAPFLFGALLAVTVFGLKRFFTVRLDMLACLAVVLGCAAVYFLAWGEFPLRGPAPEFSFWERELPEAVRNMITDWSLPSRTAYIWGLGEALAIALPPVITSLRRAGVFMPRYNRWAKLKILDYGFTPFHDHELDRLAQGDVPTLLRKPIDLTGHRRIHCAALCYAGDELTEYFAVFKAAWNRQGYIEKGSLLLLTVFPADRIETLQDDLYEIHRESELAD
jgi:hypothetical protein